MCAPIAALPLKADRDAAIAELDAGLHAVAHALVGSMRSPHTVFAAAGYNREAARAKCAPIAALQLKTDRDAAIAKLDKGLHAAAHALVGNMRSPHTVFAAAGYNREAAHALLAPIAALQLKTDRDAAIAKLDEGLHPAAAHAMIGSMRARAHPEQLQHRQHVLEQYQQMTPQQQQQQQHQMQMQMQPSLAIQYLSMTFRLEHIATLRINAVSALADHFEVARVKQGRTIGMVRGDLQRAWQSAGVEALTLQVPV